MSAVEAEVARSPLPEGIEQYAGKWIALRDGQVVASADDFNDLIANPDVLSGDAFYRVPVGGACFY